AATVRKLFLPLASVEGLGRDRQLLDRPLIQAARVDAVAVGMRARHIERLDAAHRAEKMLRHAGVESIRGEEFRALEQAEARLRHDQVQEPRLRADRAIALGDREAGGRLDFEADPAAMTTSAMNGHRSGTPPIFYVRLAFRCWAHAEGDRREP